MQTFCMTALDAQLTGIINFRGEYSWRGRDGRFIKAVREIRADTPSSRRKLKRHRDAVLTTAAQGAHDRFEHLIAEANDNGCRRWLGHFDRRGYGLLRVSGKARKAHRVAWALAHPGEEMPQVVMHTCDNRWCVAAEHLVGGTQADNLRDAAAKGRMFMPRGQKRISDDDVVEIRRMRREGATLDEIAGRFNCSWAHVSNICAGRKRAGVVEVVMQDGRVAAGVSKPPR